MNKEGQVFSPFGRKLKLKQVNNYYRFNIKDKIKGHYYVKVHRLCAYQKYGEKIFESGVQVRHLNGNSLDNSYGNIGIGTSSANRLDICPKKRKALASNASKNLRALTDEDLTEFWRDRNNGMSYKELSNKYKIAKSTISYIINGKTYK